MNNNLTTTRVNCDFHQVPFVVGACSKELKRKNANTACDACGGEPTMADIHLTSATWCWSYWSGRPTKLTSPCIITAASAARIWVAPPNQLVHCKRNETIPVVHQLDVHLDGVRQPTDTATHRESLRTVRHIGPYDVHPRRTGIQLNATIKQLKADCHRAKEGPDEKNISRSLAKSRL